MSGKFSDQHKNASVALASWSGTIHLHLILDW